MNTTDQAKLIYVGDPMCSWCYGIANELSGVKEKYQETIEFEMIMGGLRPYNTQVMTELKDFLSHHWEDVEKMSGQTFNYSILDNDQISYDTEPPSRATIVVRDLAPEKAFDFFKLTQEAFYQQNKNMHLLASYSDALETLGIDMDAFAQAFQSEKYKSLIKADFQKSADIGVRSFPTLILYDGKKYHMIAQGYSTKEAMIQKIEQAMSK